MIGYYVVLPLQVMTVVTLDAPPMKAANIFRCWLVPGLLCVIATLHLVRVYALDQSAWGAGCGFGMFSKVDYHGSRIQRCEVETNQGTFRVDLHAHFPELDFQAKVLPTEENLQRLVQAVATTRWALPAGATQSRQSDELTPVKHHLVGRANSTLLQPLSDDLKAVVIDHVRVEQWRIRFHANDQLIRTWQAKVAETRPTASAEEVRQ